MTIDDPGNRSRTPRRRTVLIASAAAASGLAVGALARGLGTRTTHSPDQVQATNQTSSPEPGALWENRDKRFLNKLAQSRKSHSVIAETPHAVSAVRVRDVLPLHGLGEPGPPWFAATLIGRTKQLQIVPSAAETPKYVLELPEEHKGEITSITWDQRRHSLYLSALGRVWLWQPATPEALHHIGQVPGATALYELVVDPDGALWGGTYPLGAVFSLDPTDASVNVFSRVAEDCDYVRRLTLDSTGSFWAGTGSINPRLFTFSKESPEQRTEIPLRTPQKTGFVTSIRAGVHEVRVTVDGQPDAQVLDIKQKTWTRTFDASEWVQPPSSQTIANDLHYTVDNQAVFLNSPSSRRKIGDTSLENPTSVHATQAGTLLIETNNSGFSIDTLTPNTHKPFREDVKLAPASFRVQSLLAHSDGTVYVGGFMGKGLHGFSPDSGALWDSPDEVDSIHQIENMIDDGQGGAILGTYSWADVILCNLRERDLSTSYVRAARLASQYRQSRPYGLAQNATTLFVGTVPDYGISGGVLAGIDRSTQRLDWVLDGDGDGFIPGHSIIGLFADQDQVFGVTSVRNGSGVPDTEGQAQIFMLDAHTKKLIWQTSPVPDAGALYAPTILGGWLLVADLQGINVIDPRSGTLEARHRLGTAMNSSFRPGWAGADLAVVADGRKVVHCAAGEISVVDFVEGSTASVTWNGLTDAFGSRVSASPGGRVFGIGASTSIVELDV